MKLLDCVINFIALHEIAALFIFLLLSYKCSLYISHMSIIRCMNCKYFLLVFSLSFHYLVVSFKEQNLKILMKSNLLFFSFMSLAF